MLFISHAHEDHELAGRLCAALESAGVQCWIAPRDVTPGQNYAVEIVRGIEASEVVVLLVSTHANTSAMVAREIERAVSKNKTVLPVRISGAMPTGTIEFLVAGQHWLDSGDAPIEQCVDQLIRAIRKGERVDSVTHPDVEPAVRPGIQREEQAGPEHLPAGTEAPGNIASVGEHRATSPHEERARSKVFLFLPVIVGSVALAWFAAQHKNRLTAASPDSIGGWQASCLVGEWREQYDNPFHWMFTVDGDILHIQRTDRFVSGDFARSGDRYEGSLHFGNGETWSNIQLTPNAECTEVATNRSWWYRR